jgi:uncharacterized membrane protein
MSTYAPLQMVMLAFEDGKFEGKILAELKRLREEGIVRLAGLVFVAKNRDGTLTTIQESDLEPVPALMLGTAMRELMGSKQLPPAPQGAIETSLFGYTDADIRRIAREIPAGTAVALALFEHLWAHRLKDAVIGAGGHVVADGLVGPSALVAIHDEFGQLDPFSEALH